MVCPGDSHRDTAPHTVFCFLGFFRASAPDAFHSSVAGFLGDRAGGGFAWIFEKAPVDLDKVGRIFGASCEIIRL